MKIHFLGTNAWYDTDAGNTVCMLINTGREYIILDAGTALYKIDRFINDEKPIYLFLSHLHFDHIIGLHILNKFNFKQGLTIYGPPGTKEALKMLINSPFTKPMDQLPYPVTVMDLEEGVQDLPVQVEAAELLHADLTFGYRFRIDGKSIAYCPDTGYCDNAVKLAREADLCIAECALRSGEYVESWPHLNPEEAARLANDARAGKLVLVHFAADRYLSIEDKKTAETQARKTFDNTVAALDDLTIEV